MNKEHWLIGKTNLNGLNKKKKNAFLPSSLLFLIDHQRNCLEMSSEQQGSTNDWKAGRPAASSMEKC